MLVIFWIYNQRKYFPSVTNYIFQSLLIISITTTAFDLIGIYVIINAAKLPDVVDYVVNIIYLLTNNAVGFGYYIYVLSVTHEYRTIGPGLKLYIGATAVLVATLIISSPWTHAVFYFDENYEYLHGIGIYILYGIGSIYVLLSLFDTIKFYKLITRAQKNAVFFYSAIFVIMMGLQIIFPKVILVNFGISLCIVLVYLALINPADLIDKLTDTFNRVAFVDMINSFIRRKSEFTVICLELDDFKFISKTLGTTNGDQIIMAIAKFLKQCASDKQIYHLSGDQFAILMKHHDNDIDNIVDKIQTRFKSPFMTNGIEIMVTPLLCCVHYPENANYVDDVLDAIDSSILEAKQIEQEQGIVYANESMLLKKRRESAINHITRRAIQNHEFEVFYQPVYSFKDSSYHCAEALIRLEDPALGYISPDEFIPISERNGSVLQIGLIVFETVCSFIMMNKLWEKGVDYISINLSVVQCMQEQLSTKLLEVMDLYHVPHKMINLEIKESALQHSQDILLSNMNHLKDEGVTFSLDGYGIGLSSGRYIFDFPFKAVKFDKELIWASLNNPKAWVALKHTIAMLNDLQYEVVAEGIETPEQAETLTSVDCDQLQGFHYAHPLPAKEFLEFIQQHQ